jgi:acyl carrier protein
MTAPELPMLEAVIRVIAKHFRADVGSINSATTALDVRGWDSLNQTLLLMRLEQELGVRIDPRAASQAATVGELAVVVEAARGKKA